MSEFEQRLFLRETLAIALYESYLRAILDQDKAQPWYPLESSKKDVWRSRAAKLISDEMQR